MKITAVKTIGMRWECPVMSDAMSICRARQALWIRVETDCEIYGICLLYTSDAADEL